MAKIPKANMNFLLEEISPSKNQEGLAALQQAGKHLRSGPGGYSTRSSNASESQLSTQAPLDSDPTKPEPTLEVTKATKHKKSRHPSAKPSSSKSSSPSTYSDPATLPNPAWLEQPSHLPISHTSDQAFDEPTLSRKRGSAVSSEDIKNALSIEHIGEKLKALNPITKQQLRSRDSTMSSSQRNNRQQRNGPRGHDDHDLGEQSMWSEALTLLKDVEKDEKKASEWKGKIFDTEKKLGAKKAAGEGWCNIFPWYYSPTD